MAIQIEIDNVAGDGSFNEWPGLVVENSYQYNLQRQNPENNSWYWEATSHGTVIRPLEDKVFLVDESYTIGENDPPHLLTDKLDIDYEPGHSYWLGILSVVNYNPIVEVGLYAGIDGGWIYQETSTGELDEYETFEPYIGFYHLHEDGTAMTGQGSLGISHEINSNEIIIQTDESVSSAIAETYETIEEIREIVSDLFYKLWFSENTLSDDQVLSLQTTIRDGKKQTGRTESEPLVFYKKDRNTLENREDLQSTAFEQICTDIFDNEIPLNLIPGKFTFSITETFDRSREKDTGTRGGSAKKSDAGTTPDSSDVEGEGAQY